MDSKKGSHPAPVQGQTGSSHTRAPETLPRSRRLSSTALFREAYDGGRHWVGDFMVMWLRTGPGASLRLGVVASRKVGNAVYRARAKRRLREAWRRNRSRFRGDYDVVLVARRSIISASWESVVADLLHLAGRAGLTKGTEE